jgi:kinesin family protein 1
MAEAGEGNIKVVVRCRPLNARGMSLIPGSILYLLIPLAEISRGARPLVRMQGNQTLLDPPESGSAQDSRRATERKTMMFSFDKSYWSAGSRDEPEYCSQQTLFDDLGKELLEHGFAGFNACILACEWFSLLPRTRNINMLDFRRSNWYADELNFEPSTKINL